VATVRSGLRIDINRDLRGSINIKTLGCCICDEESSSSSSSSSSSEDGSASSVSISTFNQGPFPCGSCEVLPVRWSVTLPAGAADTHPCLADVESRNYTLTYTSATSGVCKWVGGPRFRVGSCAGGGGGPCDTSLSGDALQLVVQNISATNRLWNLSFEYRLTGGGGSNAGGWYLNEPKTNDCLSDKPLAFITGSDGACNINWNGADVTATPGP